MKTVVQTYRCAVEGADKSVTIAILCGGDGSFRFDDRVDTTDCFERVSRAPQNVFGGKFSPRLATSVAISKR